LNTSFAPVYPEYVLAAKAGWWVLGLANPLLSPIGRIDLASFGFPKIRLTLVDALMLYAASLGNSVI
jgi:hypothetical protein